MTVTVTKKRRFGIITERNVNDYLSNLTETKGDYITQGVSFNKEDAHQMNLLRLTLLKKETSFSGLVKSLLMDYFKDVEIDFDIHPLTNEDVKQKPRKEFTEEEKKYLDREADQLIKNEKARLQRELKKLEKFEALEEERKVTQPKVEKPVVVPKPPKEKVVIEEEIIKEEVVEVEKVEVKEKPPTPTTPKRGRKKSNLSEFAK